MSLLNKLERRLQPVAIANITLYIVIAQTFVFLTSQLRLIDPRYLWFVPSWFLQGDFWRIVTFIAIPPSSHWLFMAFALYLFYLYGSALEQYMGVVRYNLFLFSGYALTVGLAFVTPNTLVTNLFLAGAVFLAYAFLNPDFTLMLFFILPVKIKWLALIAWVGYAYTFAVGDLAAKLSVVGGVGNFFLFFGIDVVRVIRTGQRSQRYRARRAAEKREMAETPMHTCSVCGRTSNSDPELDFRYRTEGEQEICYCGDHLPSRE